MSKTVLKVMAVCVLFGGLATYGADMDFLDMPVIGVPETGEVMDLELPALDILPAESEMDVAQQPVDDGAIEAPLMLAPAEAPEAPLEAPALDAAEVLELPLGPDAALGGATVEVPAIDDSVLEAPITDTLVAPELEAPAEVPALEIPVVEEVLPSRLPVAPTEPRSILPPNARPATVPAPVTVAQAPAALPNGQLDTSSVVMAGARANLAARSNHCPRKAGVGCPTVDVRGSDQLIHRCPRPSSGYVPQYPRRNGHVHGRHGPMMDPYYTLRGPRDFYDPNPRSIGP